MEKCLKIEKRVCKAIVAYINLVKKQSYIIKCKLDTTFYQHELNKVHVIWNKITLKLKARLKLCMTKKKEKNVQ